MNSDRFLESRPSPWARGLAIGACGLLIVYVFWGQIFDVLSHGRSGAEQGYVFLAPLVAVYLMALRRSRLREAISPSGSWAGVLVMAAAFVCSEVGHDRDILVLWHAAPLVAVVGLMLAVLGLERWLALSPGMIVLFAALPLPGTIRTLVAQPLQGFATSVTASVLDFVGVDAERLGNLIEINGVPVAVGEACNGMRLVMPLAIVMYAFVFSLPLRPLMRLFLIAMSLPVAIACNVVRLVPTSLAYGFLEEWAPSIHDVGGWLMIPLAILMMLGILRAFEWLDLPVARLRLAVS